MSATRERAARLTDAWSRAGGVAPVASGLRRGAAAAWAAGRRHPRAALAAALAGLLLVVGCFWLWFKDSPLVSVERVQVTGLSGPDVPQIRQALAAAGVGMTTLDVDLARLRAAARPYPDVRSLTVSTQFPHGMVIRVVEQVPIAQIDVNGSPMALSRDGTLLRPTAGTTRLPLLTLAGLPRGTHVSGSGALATLSVLAAAPYSFLSHIQSAQETAQNGVVVRLRRGPQITFGDTTQLHDKWSAALAVLGTPSAQGAEYIDVTDPGRPAAGAATASGTAAGSSGVSSPAGTTAAGSSTAGSASTGTAGTSSGTASSAGAGAGTAGGPGTGSGVSTGGG